MADAVHLSPLLDLPFKTVRVWIQRRRRLGLPAASSTIERAGESATPLPSDSDEGLLRVMVVVLREDNPSWPAATVAAAAYSCLSHCEGLDAYVSSCINAFILRGCAKVLRDDPKVGLEDAKTIAVFAFLQRVADVFPK